jgi:hypothetical protein
MVRPSLRLAVLAVTALAGCGRSRSGLQPTSPATEPERLHRIFDFTPVSESNPLVARVDGTPVEIPMLEFQAYLDASMSAEDRAALSPESKRRHLDRLIDEELLLWDAYRRAADRSGEPARMLEGTRRMLLSELLTKLEVDDKARSKDHHAELKRALRDALFDRATVVVSNEAYAALKAARARPALPAGLADRPLARCLDQVVTVGDVWKKHRETPAETRGDLGNAEVLTAYLRDLTEETLAVDAARQRGINRTLPYREKVEANRAALTRMWIQNGISQEAARRAGTAEAELRRWYEERRQTHYTQRGADGQPQVVPFEREKESIRNDYLDELRERVREDAARALREGRSVEVDDRLARSA